MHILTGLVLAALIGRKKKPSRDLLPRLSVGPIQTAHAMPGRVRFRIPSLAVNGTNPCASLDRLRNIAGVESVDFTEVTGSVVIRYDRLKVQPNLLLAALAHLLGLEEEMEKLPRPRLAKELRAIGDSLNRAVYQQTGGLIDLWTALVILLGIYGARRVLAERSAAIPAGFTLIWWSLNALKDRKPE